MDERIKKLKSTTFFGHRLTRRQLGEIQQTVSLFENLSRTELAQTISEHLGWHTSKGVNRYQSALLLLEELEQLGVVQLPPKQSHLKRGKSRPLALTARTEEQAELQAELSELMPLSVQLVTSADQAGEFNEWVERYHYLGYRHPIGANLRYFIVDGQGRKLGCLLFQYAVKALPCRDVWVGWQDQKHKKHLHLAVNNSRFLIFPWVRVKNLASKALSLVCRQLPQDWQCQHGCRPVLIETFVDETRFEASSYRAANWQYLGTTEKRSGKTPKGVYVYPLEEGFREILAHGEKARAKRKKRAQAAMPKPLASSDSFVQLWQHLIGEISEVAAEFDEKWRVRRRVIDTMLLMLFIFRLVFSDNRQGYATCLYELWAQCRDLEIRLPQPQPVTAAAMSRARAKLDEQVFKVLQQRILQRSEAQRKDFLWQGHRLHAVDGSRLNLPRKLLKNGYRTPNDKAHYPQGLVSCLYQLKARVPIDFELASHGNERKLALTHLKQLDENDVVVYDRGYYSYEMLHAHWLQGVEAVFRLQKNLTVAMDRFMDSERTDEIIEVEPTAQIRTRIRRRHAQVKCPPLKLRLVKYTHADTTYTLAVTLQDPVRYPISDLSDLYHQRWGIEEMYKISKSWLSIEQFHAKSERGVKQELYAHFVLITLTRIFTNYSEDRIQGAPEEDRKQVNFKHALKVMARSLEQLVLRQAELIASTVNAIVSSISRQRQKQRPDRSYARQSKQPRNKWIRKRNQPQASTNQ